MKHHYITRKWRHVTIVLLKNWANAATATVTWSLSKRSGGLQMVERGGLRLDRPEDLGADARLLEDGPSLTSDP